MASARHLRDPPDVPNSNRRTDDESSSSNAPAPADSPRLQALIAKIARRLGPVCPDMPPEEFVVMVRKAAEATYRWETRTARIGDQTP